VPEAFNELMNVYQDSNPIRMMELMMSLTELGTKSGLLTDEDRAEITLFNHVLSKIAQHQVELLKSTIAIKKAPL